MNAADHRIYLSEILKSKGVDAEIQAQPYMNDDKANRDYFRYIIQIGRILFLTGAIQRMCI
jgi:hypothetical protein